MPYPYMKNALKMIDTLTISLAQFLLSTLFLFIMQNPAYAVEGAWWMNPELVVNCEADQTSYPNLTKVQASANQLIITEQNHDSIFQTRRYMAGGLLIWKDSSIRLSLSIKPSQFGDYFNGSLDFEELNIYIPLYCYPQ